MLLLEVIIVELRKDILTEYTFQIYTQVLHLAFEGYHCDFRHEYICSVKAVQTIRSHGTFSNFYEYYHEFKLFTFLSEENSLFLHILSEKFEIFNHWLHFQNQRIDFEELMSFTSMMEIEKFITVVWKVIISNMILIGIGDQLFARFPFG